MAGASDSSSFYRYATAALFLAALFVVLTTFTDYGITWDEHYHEAYGRHVLDYYRSGFRDHAALTYHNLRLYGGVFDGTVTLFKGVSPFGNYESAHLMNALVGLIGALAVYRIGDALAGPRGGFWATLLLLAIPTWYGHMFNNPKDIPFAAGMTWSLYFMIRAAPHFPRVPAGITLKLGLALMRQRIAGAVERKMAEKAANFGPEVMRQMEKSLLLQILDQTWKDHLFVLDHLRQGIVLRAYGQKDPLDEYKREAFNLFERMLVAMRETVTQYLCHVEIRADQPIPEPVRRQEMIETRNDSALAMAMQGSDEFLEPERLRATGTDGGMPLPMRRRATAVDPNDPDSWGRVQRNAPCPCGSGKKFKHCHGRVS